jgi:hypothetical protein
VQIGAVAQQPGRRVPHTGTDLRDAVQGPLEAGGVKGSVQFQGAVGTPPGVDHRPHTDRPAIVHRLPLQVDRQAHGPGPGGGTGRPIRRSALAAPSYSASPR